MNGIQEFIIWIFRIRGRDDYISTSSNRNMNNRNMNVDIGTPSLSKRCQS